MIRTELNSFKWVIASNVEVAVYKFLCAGYQRFEVASDLQCHPYGESILLEQYEQPKFLQINDRQFLAHNRQSIRHKTGEVKLLS